MITHNARITGPIDYLGAAGKSVRIPPGPCVIEQIDAQLVDVIWGSEGEESAVLQAKEIEAAELNGRLVLLD